MNLNYANAACVAHGFIDAHIAEVELTRIWSKSAQFMVFGVEAHIITAATETTSGLQFRAVAGDALVGSTMTLAGNTAGTNLEFLLDPSLVTRETTGALYLKQSVTDATLQYYYRVWASRTMTGV